MLKELQVKNFAIINDARIRFGNGLNVLTGETGAGKTLIIEAINLLIGERAESELIREDEERLIVQGYFDFSKDADVLKFLRERQFLDSDDDGNEVIITREVNKKDKNKAFINGIFTQVGILKELGNYFLDMHGQHEHQYLLDHSNHIKIVDDFGGEEISNAKSQYSEVLERYLSLKSKLNNLRRLQEKREEKINDLTYRINEINGLNIKDDEEEEISNQLRVLKNHEKIFNLAAEAVLIVKPEDPESLSLNDNLSNLGRYLTSLSEIDNNFKKFLDSFNSSCSIIEEIGHFLSSYLEEFEFSSEKLDNLQSRLFRLSEIKKKYSMSLKEIMQYSEKIDMELKDLESLDSEINVVEQKTNACIEDLKNKAFYLSNLRKDATGKLKDLVTSELESLKFNSVSFIVMQKIIESGYDIRNDGNVDIKLNKDGMDEIEFYISLNVGEKERPLRKVASGGEISRIMLAIKSAMCFIKNISTMIFDEIDAGIGGATSLVVGEKLYRISRSSQVIVITHQAQIACFSDSHLFIDKYIEKDRTLIRITRLTDSDRVREIARMLSGSGDSGISQMHASELIEKGKNIKIEIMEGRVRVGN